MIAMPERPELLSVRACREILRDHPDVRARIKCELVPDGSVWTRAGGWLLALSDTDDRAFGDQVGDEAGGWPWRTWRVGTCAETGRVFYVLGEAIGAGAGLSGGVESVRKGSGK